MKDVLQVFSVLTDSFDSCKSHWRRDEWAAVSSRKMQKSSPSCDFWVPWHLPRWLYSWNYSELFSVYWCKQRYCKTSPDKALEQCPLNPQKQQSGQQSASLFDFFLIFFLPWTSQDIPSPSLARDLRPNLDSSFFTVCQIFFGKRPSLAVSLWNILTHPTNPSSAQASSSGPRSLYQLFVRDLPPQSHKSTEDRCLLCLIKALPPGVIPQFEQEEKPSEGGNVLDQSYEGPILYTLI